MTDLLYSSDALEDLDATYAYTLNAWGSQHAEQYISLVEEACSSFNEQQSLWREIFLNGDFRILHRKIEHHIVFILVKAQTNIVIAVFHERMDLMTRLEGRLS